MAEPDKEKIPFGTGWKLQGKTCCRCGKDGPFGKDLSKLDGLKYVCKKCEHKRSKDLRKLPHRQETYHKYQVALRANRKLVEEQNAKNTLNAKSTVKETKYLDFEDSLSFRYPEIASMWHPTKNGNLKPDNIKFSAIGKAWFKCPIGEDHEWEVRLPDLRKSGKCPYCSHRKLSYTNSLLTLRPDIALELHPTKNGEVTSKDVMVGSHKKLWFLCNKGHEWLTGVSNRFSGTTCPYCSNNKVSDTNSLRVRYPEVSALWHPTKNVLKPDGVLPGSHTKFWFLCKEGHEWVASLNNMTSNGSGCPTCANLYLVGEDKLASIIVSVLNGYTIKRQARFSWLGRQSFDIFVEELNLAIEHQGVQHFKPVDFFGGAKSFSKNQQRDQRKRKACLENGVLLMKFRYDEPYTEEHVRERIHYILSTR